MYKQTPMEYKRNRDFYPLQLAFGLNKSPGVCLGRPGEISHGALEDIPEWMAFVRQVLDGFPGFHEEEHRESIRSSVRDGRALLMRDGGSDHRERLPFPARREPGASIFWGCIPSTAQSGGGRGAA